jgi:hypothetical protein
VLRQVWIYMDEADEAEVIARLSEGHGLRRLSGRFFKGSTQDVRERSEELETAQLKATERWIHLIHPTISKELVVHALTEGPFAGWSRLDEVRSEVITLVRPLRELQGLGPGHLQANTHAWFGGVKTRKSPAFASWASDAMRLVETYPATAFDWIRAAPAALAASQRGERLHYLYKTVEPAPLAKGTPLYRPHASLGD